MKKIYCQPEWELLIVEEDIITQSYSYDDGGIMDNDSVDNWEW